MNNEIALVNPAEQMRMATDVAGTTKDVIVRTAVKIQGRQYIPVDGWRAIAVAHGCVLSSGDVERIEGGVRAKGQVRRISDGLILSEAEGFVGDDEKTWASRPEYAKRAMAQTRSESRAARSAFAHVVVLMNAGFETTPAEEVPAEGFDRAKDITPKKIKEENFEKKVKDALVRADGDFDKIQKLSDWLDSKSGSGKKEDIDRAYHLIEEAFAAAGAG